MRGQLFFVCFAAVSTGILIGRRLSPVFILTSCIILVVVIIALYAYRFQCRALLLLIILFIFSGAATSTFVFCAMKNGVVPWEIKEGSDAVIQGQVKSYPVIFSDSTYFIVQCRSIESSGRKWRSSERINVIVNGQDKNMTVYPGLNMRIRGKVVVRASSGDRLSKMGAVAELSTLPDSMRIVDNGALIPRAIEAIRKRLEEGIDRVFGRRVSPIVKGYSLGSMNELDTDTQLDISGSGLSHIVAVSGMHIASTVAIIIILAGRLGMSKKTGVFVAVVFAFIVIAISGFRPSAVRSLIMVVTGMAAGIMGRRHNAYTGLSLAGITILLLNPRALFDLGFQFSFAAVIGILVVAGNVRNTGLIRSMIAVWSGAQIGIMPVMLIHSRQVPVTSLPANMAAVPFFGPALLIGLFAAGLSFLSIAAGKIIGMPAVIYANSLLWISNRFSSFPKARMSLFVPGIALVVFCVSLLMIALCIKKNEKLIKALAVMFISFLILCMPGQIINRFNSGNRIVVLDVGQGDSILIQDKNGISVLVDGGPDGEVIVEKLNKYGIRKIDIIVLTHPHQDHIAGLITVVKKFHVGGILAPHIDDYSSSYRELKRESERKGIKCTTAEAGQVVRLSAQCSLDVLYPDSGLCFGEGELNNSSTVIMCRLGEARALLMGDAEVDAQDILIKDNNNLECEVLKVPHQGSSDSASLEFVEECRPEIAVISVGADNEYGHPSKECIELFGNRGIKTFRTDKMGDIVVSIKDEMISVKAERDGK